MRVACNCAKTKTRVISFASALRVKKDGRGISEVTLLAKVLSPSKTKFAFTNLLKPYSLVTIYPSSYKAFRTDSFLSNLATVPWGVTRGLLRIFGPYCVRYVLLEQVWRQSRAMVNFPGAWVNRQIVLAQGTRIGCT